MRARSAALCLLAAALAACATLDDDEREVRFPRGKEVVCERPAPRPAIVGKSPGVMSSEFRRMGTRRAREVGRLADGVYLDIRHEACGPESQTFKFYLPRAAPAPADEVAAYARAASLLEGIAPPGPDGEALRELARPLSEAAGKGQAVPPLGTLLPMGEFQEMMLRVSSVAEPSVYGTVLTVSYRLKL